MNQRALTLAVARSAGFLGGMASHYVTQQPFSPKTDLQHQRISGLNASR